MKFIISMGNAAFSVGNEGAELADRIENAGEAPRYFENIRDYNGNTVGPNAAKPADYA